MYLYPGERKASLSIREFAEFRTGPSRRTGGSLHRAAIGTAWHNELRDQCAQKNPDAIFEITINGKWAHKNWVIELQGRIDQIVEDKDMRCLREIKSTSFPIPSDEDELINRYPGYFTQLAAYVELDKVINSNTKKSISGELVFVNINDGITQTIRVDNTAALFERKMDELHYFLEERWSGNERIRRCEFKKAFEKPRPGQEESLQALNFNFHKSRIQAFEAPTGFGKTGIMLQFALERVAEGHFSRILFLTGKSTGQLQAVKQIQNMLPENDALLFFQMRNIKEHEQDLPHGWIDKINASNYKEEWDKLQIPPSALFKNNTVTLDQVKKIGIENNIHPYEISRSCIPFADIIIADYNYIFAPDNKHIIFDQPGFDPKQTLLIIDEAHNLPSRAGSAYSQNTDLYKIEKVIEELKQSSTHPALICAWKLWQRFIDSLEKSDKHDLSTEYEAIDIIETLIIENGKYGVDYELLSEEANETINSIYKIKRFIDSEDIVRLIWSPDNRKLSFTCLDASAEIASTLKSFGSSLLMSATLEPINIYQQNCGLTESELILTKAYAPWRDNAYQIAVDTRVDTRLNQRERHYGTTAQTIIESTENMDSPVAVFFSSYKYAETIKTYIEAASPLMQVSLQPRKTNLQEQYDFIQEALLCAHAIFLVLGSSFTESIDLLGGKVQRAIVVGPALPEVNAVQRALMNKFPNKEDAFYNVYQIPAFRKINQALGRLVRAPGHSAQVLLHDKRFAEDSYLKLLSPEYDPGILKSSEEVLQWFRSKPVNDLKESEEDLDPSLPSG